MWLCRCRRHKHLAAIKSDISFLSPLPEMKQQNFLHQTLINLRWSIWQRFFNLDSEIEIKAQMRFFCHISAEQIETVPDAVPNMNCSGWSRQERNKRVAVGEGRHRWVTNGSEYSNPLPPSDQLILWLTAGLRWGLKTGYRATKGGNWPGEWCLVKSSTM